MGHVFELCHLPVVPVKEALSLVHKFGPQALQFLGEFSMQVGDGFAVEIDQVVEVSQVAACGDLLLAVPSMFNMSAENAEAGNGCTAPPAPAVRLR